MLLTHRILLIEKSSEMKQHIDQALQDYSHEITQCMEFSSAREALYRTSEFDLILMDLDLSASEGLSFLSLLYNDEQFKKTPVILVSKKEDLDSKVTAFSLGADDFIVKPFHPIEFRARIQMRLRKVLEKKKSSDYLRRGNLWIRTSLMKAMVKLPDQEIALELTSKEFKILCLLAKEEGNVLTRDQIVKAVWGRSIHVMERTVDSHICMLRRKIKKSTPLVTHHIESVPGAGYRFSPRSDNLQSSLEPHFVASR